MRLVDTSAWIEWLSASALDGKIIPLLPVDTEWLVPTIVQFELAKWLAREKSDPERAGQVIAFSGACVVAPLTTAIALRAAELGRNHKLAVADAIIYATAREFDADLLTCDAHFEGLKDVLFIRKKTPRATSSAR